MGQSVSAYTSYANHRPNAAIIAAYPHAPFPSNITAGLAQDPPSTAALQDLSGFMKLFFYPPISDKIWVAFFTGLLYLGLLIIAGLAIAVYRFRRGQFWIIRLERRARGLYIVPNALNAFLLFELAFCFAWGIYGIAVFESYRNMNRFLIRKLACLEIYMWLPLYLGILSAAIGSFFSVPGALDPGSNAARFHRAMRRPGVINAITIGLPLALAAGILPLSILAQLSRTRQLDHFLDFARRIDASIAASTVNNIGLDSTVAQSYLQEASDLWSESGRNKWTRAGWSVWNAFYCFLFLFYSIAGGWMLIVVKRQVDASRAIVDKEERYSRELVAAHRDDGTALLFQPLLSPGITVIPSPTPLSTRKFISKTSPSPTATAFSSPSTACSPLQSEKKYSRTDDVEATVGPTLSQTPRPSAPPQPVESTPPTVSAAVLRWRYLRRCYRSLLIMYAGIIAVLGVSIGTGAFLAASIAREWLKGPYQSAYVLDVYVLLQTWSRVVFGTITLGAVVFRSFDHSAMSGASSNTPSDKRDVPAIANSRIPAASEANGGVDSVISTTSPTEILQDSVGSNLASVPEHATMSPPVVRSLEEVELSDSCQALLTEPISQTADATAPSTPALTESHDDRTEANGPGFTTASLPPPRRSVGNAFASVGSVPSSRSASMAKIDVLPRPASSHSLHLLALHPGTNPESRARRFSATAPPPNRPLPTPVLRPDRRPGSASSVSSSATTRQRRASNSMSLAQRRASANAELASSARLLQLSATTEARRGSCLIATEYTPADRTGWRAFVPEEQQGNAASLFQAGWNGFCQSAPLEEDCDPDSGSLSALQQPVAQVNSVPPSPAATDVSSGEVDHLSELMPRSALTERAIASKAYTGSSSPPLDSPVDCEAFRFEQNTP